MSNFYHYTDDEGAQSIIRSGTIQASLRNMTNGDTAFSNGVYLTECSPFTHTKDEIEMNNWTRSTAETRRKLKNYFIITIPDCDIKKKNTRAKGRNIFLFGYGNDLRLHKYPWMLVDFNSERVIASYKYRVTSHRIGDYVISQSIGDYVMTDEIVNGRPVYMKTPDSYLYIGSHGAWFVGPCIGRDNGYLRHKRYKNSLGPDPNGPWKYCDLKNLWSFDHTLAVKPFGKKIFLNFDLKEVEEKCPTFNLNIFEHLTTTSEGKEEMTVKRILKISEGVQSPSCMTILHDKNIVIGCAKDDSVKLFRPDGTFLAPIESVRPFKNPSAIITLSTGEFVVQDDGGLQLFTENGVYAKALGTSRISKCFGLAEDEDGNVITINLPKHSLEPFPEEKEEILLFISRESGEVIDRIKFRTPIESKCGFLSFHNKTIYITDVGRDCIYTLQINERKYMGKIGGIGTGPKQFRDPAGIVFDDLGNFIVADRWNQRLQIFDWEENFVGLVAIDFECPPCSATSGDTDNITKRWNTKINIDSIHLDTELNELYVLNYCGNSIVKYRITC